MDDFNLYCGYSSVLLEEIALEGLDGITFEILLVRLNNNPNWCLKPIDNFVEEFIWKKLVLLTDVCWYSLPSPKECPLIFSSIEEYLEAIEKRTVNPSSFSSNVYPHYLIKDGDIVGSCPSYSDRIDITDEVRKLSLSEANERWGGKLVIVANQEVRNHVLLAGYVNPEIEIPDLSYCILERIGRARRCGDLSIALIFMRNGANMTFYFWNKLRKWKLITSQNIQLYEKIASNTIALYLTRFHKTFSNEITNAMHAIVEQIKSSPKGSCLLSEIKPLTPPEKKKFFKSEYFKRYIEKKSVPFNEYFPDCSSKDNETKSGAQKFINVYKLSSKNSLTDTEMYSQLDDSDEDESNNHYGGVLEGNRVFNKPLITQVYHVIDSAGKEGISLQEVGIKLGLRKLLSRQVVRALVKFEFVFKFLSETTLRQKFYKYYSKNYSNQVKLDLIEEMEKSTKIVGKSNAENEITYLKEEPNETINNNMEIANVSEKISPKNDSELKRKRKLNNVDKEEESKNKKFKPILSSSHDIHDYKLKLPIKVSIPAATSIATMRRMNIILEYVYKNRVVLKSSLIKIVKEEEFKKGLSLGTPDRKSLNRIIETLTENGKVKIFRKTVTEESLNRKQDITFLCAMNVSENHPMIQATVREIQNNLSILYLKYSKCERKTEMPKLISNKENSQKYGYSPKFARMKILHELLVYLLYHYEGDENLSTAECEDYIKSVYKDHESGDKIPKCYVKELSWKMFIPPLMKYEEYGEGWISQNDLVDRIPIKTFFSIVNLRYEAYGIEEYLNHPIKQLYLVRHLPPAMQRLLSLDKKYLECLYRDLKYLCMIGLIQFGPKINVRGTLNLVYVNKRAELMDTRLCPPTYFQILSNLDYPKYFYDFTIAKSIEVYWNDSFRFSTGTRLCQKKSSANASKQKNPAMKAEILEIIASHEIHEVPLLDKGKIPGDNLGAAGYDSSLFSHFIKHWIITNTDEAKMKIKREPIPKSVITKLNDKKMMTKQKRQRISLQRKINGSKRKRKCNTYDSVDLEALKKLKTMRVIWSKSEDDLLILCHIASSYYKENPIPRYKSYTLFRKIMHRESERSVDKTTESCKRRIYNLMKNSFQQHSVNLYLTDIWKNIELKEKCQGIIDEIENLPLKNDPKIRSLLDKLTETVFYYLYENNKDFAIASKGTYDLMELPNSIEEFKDRFYVDYPDTQKRNKCYLTLEHEKDAKVLVIINLIFSTLMSQIDKSKPLNVNQLYLMFKQFDDSLLKSALSYVRINRMISFNKFTNRERSSYLPFGRGTYHLSLTFHILLKCIYNTKIFSQVYNRYLELLSNTGFSTEITNYDVGITLLIITYYIHNKIDFNVTIPQNIMFFNTTPLPEIKPEDIMKPILSAKSSYTDTTLSLIRKSFFNDKETKELPKEEKSENIYENENTEEFISSDSDSDNDLNVEQDVDKLKECYGRRSEIAIFVTRNQFKLSDIRFSNAYDHFLLNMFPVKVNVDHENTEILSEEVCVNCLKEIEKNVTFKKIIFNNEDLSQKIKIHLQESYERDYAMYVLEYLQTVGSTGATSLILANEFKDFQLLKKVTNVLYRNKMIIRFGTRHTHYVHINFAKHWLVLSYRNSEVYWNENLSAELNEMQVINRNKCEETMDVNVKEQIWILIKPWIHFNGKLNRPALDSLLARVLIYIVKTPAVSLKNVQSRFIPALQPHCVRELVEILEALTIVHMKVFTMSKVSLLSKSAEFSLTENATGFEDENYIFIEPCVNAIVKLSIFIKTMNYEDLLERKYITENNSILRN